MIDYNQANIPNAKTLRKNMTPWENELWYHFLRDYPVRFQRQKAIGDYIADFYCAKAGLILELDGGGHYTKEQQEKDRLRTEKLEQLGLRVVRICNLDIDRNFRGVCEQIHMLVAEQTANHMVSAKSLPPSPAATPPSSHPPAGGRFGAQPPSGGSWRGDEGGEIRCKKEKSMKTVTIYTDGACSGNPGPGGWGAILEFNGVQKVLSGGDPSTTNNRMELLAVITALEALKESCVVELYSDSKYVIDALQKRWVWGWQKKGWIKSDKKPALNVDLWQRMLPLVERHEMRYHWVKGHAENEKNNRCDELAVAESRKYK